MSIMSNTMEHRGSPVAAFVRATGRILRSWWMAYVKWRLQQLAISQLEAMSDRELKDIAIPRAQIKFAVRDAAARDAMVDRYC